MSKSISFGNNGATLLIEDGVYTYVNGETVIELVFEDGVPARNIQIPDEDMDYIISLLDEDETIEEIVEEDDDE